MMTALGPTILQDGQAYTSVNGRVYLPDLRNTGGWVSNLYVRNGGTEARIVKVYYFNANGTPTPKVSDVCALTPNQWCWIPVNDLNRLPAGTMGSAVIDGGEDVTVVVKQIDLTYPNRIAGFSGLRPSGQGDPNWEYIGDNVYAPHVYRHDVWRYISQLTIFNPGSTSTNVYITYRDPAGNAVHATGAIPIAAKGSATTQLPTNVGNTFFGTAYLYSSAQPVGVTVDALHYDGNVDFGYTALNGATTVYLPYLMRQYVGWNSCFTIRNLSASATNLVYVTYYWGGGSWTDSYSIPANGMQNLCQTNNTHLPMGPLSAKVQSLSAPAIPVAVAVNQDHASLGRHMSYSSFSQPTTKVVLSHLLKTTDWVSGYQVQNTGLLATCPTVTYYHGTGSVALTASLACIDPGRSIGVYLPNVGSLPSGFDGSAIVTADQPLVAVGNATCVISGPCGSGDVVYTYNGVNR